MIETESYHWTLTLDIHCDKCPSWDSYDWDDFQEAIGQAKSDWWTTRKVKDMRVNYCPACSD